MLKRIVLSFIGASYVLSTLAFMWATQLTVEMTLWHEVAGWIGLTYMTILMILVVPSLMFGRERLVTTLMGHNIKSYRLQLAVLAPHTVASMCFCIWYVVAINAALS